MNLRSNIGNGFYRKAVCFSLILFVSIGFSFGGARADSCRGGADCLICAQQPHRHLLGAQTNTENSGCVPAGQESTCGFEAAQGAENAYGLASFVRSLHPVRSAIFAAASDEHDQLCLSSSLISPLSSSNPAAKAPIYLLNHSLIC